MSRIRSPQALSGRLAPLVTMMLLAVFLSLPSTADAKPGNGQGKPPGGNQEFQPESRILWEVPLLASFSRVRPVAAPDGTIYAVDAGDNLYIVPPSGDIAQVLIVPGAGSKGLDIGPDGTVYTGNENWIKAFYPDGTGKWVFNQTPRAFVFSDVAVGPDTGIYAVASGGMGAFALDDLGNGAQLRWQNPEFYDRTNASYTEIAFGPGDDGDRMYFRANQNTRGLRITDGTEVFSLALGLDRPVTSPFDGSWHRSDAAYDPDGNLLWQFSGFPAATAASIPALGADGTHYTVNQGFRVFAISPSGIQRWSTELDEGVGAPDIDPAGSQLIMPTAVTQTSPAALVAIESRNGNPLWRVELPLPATATTGLQYVDTPLAFSADGSTAYLIAGVAGGNARLFALSLDPAIPNASTLLRSTDITLKAKPRRGEVTFTGDVTVSDENRALISGARVSATWTLPDGSTQTAASTTGADGIARFIATGPGGIYTLEVTDITKDPYVYDAVHSITSGSLARF